MAFNVAINGCGRIGRLVCRILSERKDLKLVAINDLVSADHLAYLLKYDSTHGRFPGQIEAEGDKIIINGHSIDVFSEKDPQNLPWAKLNVDYVIESTGVFNHREGANKHLIAGAKRVVI